MVGSARIVLAGCHLQGCSLAQAGVQLQAAVQPLHVDAGENVCKRVDRCALQQRSGSQMDGGMQL